MRVPAIEQIGVILGNASRGGEISIQDREVQEVAPMGIALLIAHRALLVGSAAQPQLPYSVKQDTQSCAGDKPPNAPVPALLRQRALGRGRWTCHSRGKEFQIDIAFPPVSAYTGIESERGAG